MSVLGPGSIVAGTYRVIRPIGAGAMGEVYEATHARLAGRYAIKVLQPQVAAHKEALERFRREAEITSSLRHPNIVHIMDFNRLPDGSPYLVMEYLEGLDLAARLHQTGPPPLEEAVVLIGQIASALAAAHSRGVVHRDLKPHNVCLVPLPGQSRSVVKVVDFGMSKIRSAAGQLTRERAIIGTAHYMSPEQALGKVDQIDHRTDQFALAVMAYEMLTGKYAFWGENEPAILFQVVHQTPPPLVLAHPATPSRRNALAAVVERALDKDKEKRYGSILEFAHAFEDASGIVRGSGRARAIFDAREGVPTGTPGAHATGAPTVLDGPPSMTTWSRATGERLSGISRMPRWPALLVVAAAFAGSAFVLLRPRWRTAAPEPVPAATTPVVVTPAPPPVPPRPEPPPPEPPVTIEMESVPPKAAVYWDGRPTAPPITAERDAKPHHLKVEAPGFLPFEAEIVPDRNRTIVLALKRARGRGTKATRARAARLREDDVADEKPADAP
jgi:serine/threonine-protein kinase